MAAASLSTLASAIVILSSALLPLIAAQLPPCTSRLLLLAPCTPFVQGVQPLPLDACCDGLSTVYHDRPGCLCLLLDGATSLPLNRTLALNLPLLCNLTSPAISDVCPGVSLPPLSSPVDISHANSTNTSSPSAVSPVKPPASKTMNGAIPLRLNGGGNVRADGSTTTLVVAVIMVALVARAV